MSESLPRTNVVVWDEDSDEFTRVNMTDSHQGIEDRVATFFVGSSLPELDPPDPSYARALFLVTSGTPTLWHSDDTGSDWTPVTQFGSPTAMAPGSSNSAGTAESIARSDHTHALPSFGSPVATSSANSDGDAATFARANHVHAIGTSSIAQSTSFVAGVVNEAALAAGSVTETKIGTAAVTKTKIEAGQQIPTGVIWAYSGTTAPTGWVLCDGGTVSRTGVGADLFALIGTTYGPGNNSTTFNVPNLVNRFIRGGTPAATGGANEVALTTTQLPTHTHSSGTLATQNAGQHSHTVTGTTSSEAQHSHGVTESPRFFDNTGGSGLWLGASGFYQVGLQTNAFIQQPAHEHTFTTTSSVVSDHTHNVTGATASAGSGTAFSILPTYMEMRYIIKL